MMMARWSGRASKVRLVGISVGMIMLVAGLAILHSRYGQHRAATDVMAPTLRAGELTLAEPVRRENHVRRGDVVVVDGAHWSAVPPGYRFTLRVVAVGGDTVSCCDGSGRIVLNGAVLLEPYASSANDTFGRFEIVVPQGRVFLLGDERDRARDSRELLIPGHQHSAEIDDHSGSAAVHGTVAVDEVGARVLTVISPPWRFRQVSSTGPTSPHYYALAAIVLGVLLIAAGAARTLVGAARRLVPRRVRRSAPSW